MREFTIDRAEEGQKLIRFLNRILKNSSSGFLYKMLRKKNIVLNDKKATGKESLKQGDSVKIYFSEETYQKMSGETGKTLYPRAPFPMQILYEDPDILCVNKPAGILSQKENLRDPSMNEYLIRYLLDQGTILPETLKAFHPSVINRLDRNTSGILLFGKTIRGLQQGGRLLKRHDGQKTYHCIVTGDTSRFQTEQRIQGWLKKDEKENRVQYVLKEVPGSAFMEERVLLLRKYGELSLLSIVLLTGRSHQIRSSLSALGCPVLNDRKYHGRRDTDFLLENQHSLRRGQYLHAYSICLPIAENDTETAGPHTGEFDRLCAPSLDSLDERQKKIQNLRMKKIVAPDPKEFRQMMER